VHHEGEDSHLSSTTVVQLNSLLLLDSSSIPSRCLKLSSLDFILSKVETKLNKSDDVEQLEETGGGDGLKGSKAGL
jgi:hypothetical protein